MPKQHQALLYLRIGLAISFFYPALAAPLDPASWIGFIPPFAQDIILLVMPLTAFLILFSAAEIILGLWLLSGRFLRLAGALSAFFMFGITASNLGAFDIVFRDVSLGFMGIAIAFLAEE